MPAVPRAVSSAVNAWSAEYLDEQYRRFKADPASLPDDLRAFFEGFDLALANGHRVASPQVSADDHQDSISRLQSAADDLIAAFRALGHLAARLDPFGREPEHPAPLTLEHHGLSEADLDRPVDTGRVPIESPAPLRAVIERLNLAYCRTIGAEIMHVSDTEEREWLMGRYEEISDGSPLDPGLRVHILSQLLSTESFEKFLGKRYPGDKRFSIEGSETLIPLLDQIIEQAAGGNVEEVVLGMAHRGRLNVLNNIIGKTYEQIFTEFEDNWNEEAVDGGDVKYHKGYSGTREFRDGRKVHLALASNPSHLESVDSVVEGRTRAKQRLRSDTERRRVMPLLVHGDAAVIAQGMVAEVLNLSQLEGYATGGTIHVVINNLIGFTTSPEDARSTRYCTDVAKIIDAPVFHVNGEDPDAVVTVAKLAVEYRQKFRKDIFIDLICYRRYGHNEQDEPSFTQPILYSLIKNKPSVLKVYAERLLAEGVITEGDMTAIRDQLAEALERAQASAKQSPNDPTIDPGSERWEGTTDAFSFDPVDTGVPESMIAEVCESLGRTPDGYNVNRKLESGLKARRELLETREISYADAEILAYGTLLLEGVAVRLTGQDSGRGTFSHRHAVLRDAKTGEDYVPLNHMREVGKPGTPEAPGTIGSDGRPRQARFCIHDSPLSEQSVLGFEYGYSLADPNMLVLWEAQFGDFCNGAQVIIDQYIASAEVKWERWSALTMLLPHGYEGAGPEHSSARMERFLLLCGDDNLQVVYPSTAAQVFHMLRRQVKRSFRKPLVVMTPKSMLRTPTSMIEELFEGSFREILDDPSVVSGDIDAQDVERVVLCSGKIYHELAERRDARGDRHIAIVRIEQLYPFHAAMLSKFLSQYAKRAEVVWVQEEPRNAGAYLFISDRLRSELGIEARYIGRETSATPAVGSKRKHKKEQEAILSEAIGPEAAASNAAKLEHAAKAST